MEDKLSADEAKLYDRQIRLWGSKAQARIRQSKVLLIGIKGIGNEICKHLILSGVNTIVLMDDGVISQEEFDSRCEFLAGLDSVGKNRAVACLENARLLNPRVKVLCDTSNALKQPLKFYRKFDIVVITTLSWELISYVEQICGKINVRFFVAADCGQLSFTFSKMTIPNSASQTDNEEVVIGNLNIPEFKDSLEFPLDKLKYVGWRYSSNIFYLIYCILMQFVKLKDREPRTDTKEEDIKMLQEIRDKICEKFSLTTELVDDARLKRLFGEYADLCTIMGGHAAQQVVLSCADESIIEPLYIFDYEKGSVSSITLKEVERGIIIDDLVVE